MSLEVRRPTVWDCLTRLAIPVISLGVLVALLWLASHPGDRIAAQSASALASGKLRVVVAENMWGSIAAQEAGSRAQVLSIIDNPNADPHAYEPTAADARAVAGADYVILNGAGYDPWMAKLLAANPSEGRRVLTVADLAGKKEGDNPHLWYSPTYVTAAAQQITADLQYLDPHDAPYFASLHRYFFGVALRPYHQEIAQIAQHFGGTPVGATESICVYLAQALHLRLLSPAGFMTALSEGAEPTAQDRLTFEQQLKDRQIRLLVFNRQNATPDIRSLKSKAEAAGIPVVSVTETLAPASDSFEEWQVNQLRALREALTR